MYQDEINHKLTTTVYSRNNPGLVKRGMAFHWWDAEYTSLHNHDYYEFFIITSGKTNHLWNNQHQILSEKTIGFIHPENYHQFSPLKNERCVHINLAVTADKLKQLCDMAGVCLNDFLHFHDQILTLSDTDISFFKHTARDIRCMAEESNNEELTSMLLCQMLMYCIVFFNKSRFSGSNTMPEWLNHVLRRIHSPEYISCRATDIYKLSGYSAPIVIEAFRKYTGETVVSYLTKVKIDFAKNLLTSSDVTILDISLRLGFGSLSHFNRIFKEHTGFSPGKYRAAYRPIRK